MGWGEFWQGTASGLTIFGDRSLNPGHLHGWLPMFAIDGDADGIFAGTYNLRSKRHRV
jgi:hypothetical protein